MRVLAIAGWSGSGKTTLIEKLLPVLRRRGVSVSTIKHAHHRFDVDSPGKDSWRHRQAGAREVLVVSDRRLALMRELRAREKPTLEQLLARLAPVDLVLVEGFKSADVPRLEVWRSTAGQKRLPATGGRHLALVADRVPDGEPGPVLHIDDIPAIARFIVGWLRR